MAAGTSLAETPVKSCSESGAQARLEVMSRLGLLQQHPLGQGQQMEICHLLPLGGVYQRERLLQEPGWGGREVLYVAEWLIG